MNVFFTVFFALFLEEKLVRSVINTYLCGVR